MIRRAGTELRFVKVFVDSQAAIQALGGSAVRSRVVGEAISALNELATLAKRVSIVWIPAHRGHFGNSTADDLAKKGAASTNPLKMINIPVPQAALRAAIRNHCLAIWTKQWQGSTAALMTKRFYFRPSPQKARYVYKLARLELGRFVRLVSGHNNLNYFQTRIGLWGQSQCRFCGEQDETFPHLLYDCPCFYLTRLEFFQDSLPTNDMKWSVRKLIDFSYTPAIDRALIGTWAHGDPAEADDLDFVSSDPAMTTYDSDDMLPYGGE